MGRNSKDDEAAVIASVDWARLVSGTNGTILDAGAGSPASLTLARPGRLVRWYQARPRASWLQVLCVGSVLLLATEFIRPLAAVAPGLRTLIAMLVTVLSLAAGGLVALQFGHTRRLDRLLILGALLLLVLDQFVTGVLPAGLGVGHSIGFTAGSPVAGLGLAAGLAAAAFTPPDRLIVGDPRRPLLITVLGAMAAFGFAELCGLLLAQPLMAGPRYDGLGLDRTLDRPLALIVLLASVVFLVYAACDLARQGRAEKRRPPMLFAAAAVVFAAQQLSYLGLPRVSPGMFTVQDGLRLLGSVLLLAAAVAKELEIRAAVTRSAALAERRRVAEDLHDGLAQDLAFIAAHEVRLTEDLGEQHPVAVAARHALAYSRDTIRGLCDMSATPPDEALQAIAHELGSRFGVGIAVDTQPDVVLPPDAREPVARIAREAIANAVRHGHARNVVLSLRQTEMGIALRVCDDGCGIGSKGCHASEGFGLSSMRDRAVALGGQLSVSDRKSGGTELEVVLP